MTALHITWLASIAGALLFFTAGLAAMALRRGAVTPARDVVRNADAAELTMTREQLELAQRDAAAWRQRAEAAREEATSWRARAEATSVDTSVETRPGDRNELAALRARMVRLENEAREAQAARARAEVAAREVVAAREAAARDLAAAREAGARELAAARERAARTEAALRAELEAAKSQLVAAQRELDAAHTHARELETNLAARSESVRDLATENEHLKGRLRDADALRAEYVRLRTTTTETEFLKSEIARLEQELATTRAAALGAVAMRPPRSARGTNRPAGTRPTGSIGESLASVLDRFADPGTRSIAIGDPQGFVLASSGDDGLGLAAHAAQLAETAGRATQFLPVGAPAAIEVIDDHGARLSVWTFEVDGDRLLLASLAVSPPEPKRVEATLADLAAVLAPGALARGAM